MKKKHRNIVVDGVEYAWTVHSWGGVTVFKDKKPVSYWENGKGACLPSYVASHIKRQDYHKPQS